MATRERDEGSAPRREPEREDVGDLASARQQEIGPGGGPPDDAERQRRGSTPDEDVMERTMREGSPPLSQPRGTGEAGELGEPDSGVKDDGEVD